MLYDVFLVRFRSVLYKVLIHDPFDLVECVPYNIRSYDRLDVFTQTVNDSLLNPPPRVAQKFDVVVFVVIFNRFAKAKISQGDEVHKFQPVPLVNLGYANDKSKIRIYQSLPCFRIGQSGDQLLLLFRSHYRYPTYIQEIPSQLIINVCVQLLDYNFSHMLFTHSLDSLHLVFVII